MSAWRPAQIWGIADRKGDLGVGADADFNLVDPGRVPDLAGPPPFPPPREPLRRVVDDGGGKGHLPARRAGGKDGQVLGEPLGRFVTPACHRAAAKGAGKAGA